MVADSDVEWWVYVDSRKGATDNNASPWRCSLLFTAPRLNHRSGAGVFISCDLSGQYTFARLSPFFWVSLAQKRLETESRQRFDQMKTGQTKQHALTPLRFGWTRAVKRIERASGLTALSCHAVHQYRKESKRERILTGGVKEVFQFAEFCLITNIKGDKKSMLGYIGLDPTYGWISEFIFTLYILISKMRARKWSCAVRTVAVMVKLSWLSIAIEYSTFEFDIRHSKSCQNACFF